jgi:hypothetical protein
MSTARASAIERNQALQRDDALLLIGREAPEISAPLVDYLPVRSGAMDAGSVRAATLREVVVILSA